MQLPMYAAQLASCPPVRATSTRGSVPGTTAPSTTASTVGTGTPPVSAADTVALSISSATSSGQVRPPRGTAPARPTSWAVAATASGTDSGRGTSGSG